MSGKRPSVDDLIQRARDAFQSGDAELALEWATKAAEQQPDHPRVLSAMGAILGSHGLMEQAESYFRKALVADPDYEDAYLNLTRIQMQWGRYGEARRTFAKFRRLGVRFSHEATELERSLRQAPKGEDPPPEMLTSLERAVGRWPEITAAMECALTFISPGAKALVTGDMCLLAGHLLLERQVEATCLLRDAALAESSNGLGPEIQDIDGWESTAEYDFALCLGLSSDILRDVESWLKPLERAIKSEGQLVLTMGPSWSSPESTKLRKGFEAHGWSISQDSMVDLHKGLASNSKDAHAVWVMSRSETQVGHSVGFSPGFQKERPVALFCDWRRSCGHAHPWVRQALAGLGYDVVDPTLSEIEELEEPCDADEGSLGLDVERIIGAARIREYGSASIDQETTTEHLRERFNRLMGLLQKAVNRCEPQLIVTSGEGWLETWAARQASLDVGCHLMVLDGSTFPSRFRLTVSPYGFVGSDLSTRARLEWRRWRKVSEFDYGRVVARLGLDGGKDKDAIEALRSHLKIDPDKKVAVALLEPERKWLGTPGACGFESAMELAETILKAFSRQPDWHVVLWCPEEDVDGHEESLESRLEAKKRLGKKASVWSGDSEGCELTSLSEFFITTGLERSFSWWVQDKPVISTIRADWTNLGFVREATSPQGLVTAIKETLKDPVLGEEEQRLARLYMQDFCEESLVETKYDVIREALVRKLIETGSLILPVSGQDFKIQEPTPMNNP